MNKIKNKYFKIFNMIICLLFVFVLISCDTSGNKDVNELIIYTLNDFHGNLESTDGEKGAARIAGYIKNQIKESDAASLIVSAGDMFQGTGISNYTKGKSVVDVMNNIGFDLMTLGNHEFDWDLDTVLAYRDGNAANGEANFPFLGSNIIEKETATLPEYVEPYTIVERDGLKIGIIGYMGYGLEEDIATQMVEEYEFIEPVDCVKKYAYELRTKEDCNIVIAVGHDGDSTTNLKLSKLDGDYRIDAIINGHTHSNYTEEFRRPDGVKIPCIQAGNAGSYVGVVSLSLNKETKEVTGGVAYNKEMTKKIEEDREVKAMVENIVEETAHIFKRELCTAGTMIDRSFACDWAVNALQDYMQTDVAFINVGGIRANAFPIEAGEVVDVSKVFEIMPFDNTIKTVKLKGLQIRLLLNKSELCYGDNITGNSYSGYMINGEPLNDEKYYTVAAVDYIFDQATYPFKNGEDIAATGILFRDILIDNLEKIGDSGSTWSR